MLSLSSMGLLGFLLSPASVMAASTAALPTLYFQRRLGAGSYKSVYLVSVLEQAAGNDENDNVTPAALAVERLRTKREVKDEVRSTCTVFYPLSPFNTTSTPL